MATEAQIRKRIVSESAKIEKRVARALERAAGRIDIPIVALARAIDEGNVEAAARLLPSQADLEDIYSPVGTILRDATIKGGRVAFDLFEE
jgi:hypothetical protein